MMKRLRLFTGCDLTMHEILHCYFLDAPLEEEELRFVGGILLGPWAKFRTRAKSLDQKRVPAVLPAPDQHGRYAQSREERAASVRGNLHHAGIRGDYGRQVVWVAPPDAEWDAIFQFAIRSETGYGPFVVQRWQVEHGTPVRISPRVVDTEMLLRGL